MRDEFGLILESLQNSWYQVALITPGSWWRCCC